MSAHPGGGAGRAARLMAAVSFRRVSALYIFVVLFVVFSLWVPGTFLEWSVWRSMLATQSLTAIVAMGLVLPLAAGVFDLAVGAEVGVAAIVVAWMLARGGLPPAAAIVVTVLVGGLIGVFNAILVTVFRIDSFIATLGVSSVLGAVTDWVSGNQQILNLGSGFSGLATRSVGGITLPVWFMLFVAVAMWYLLERTPIGRRVYATGGNPEAARLAGVRTPLVVAVSLGVCGLLAASAGVLQSSSTAAGDPTIGPGFLLPAFAAAFLGSTQFKAGRYNVWGTVVAVYVLATGVTGLQLSGAPVWIPELFDGAALLLAVGLASRQGGPNPLGALRRVRLRRPSPGRPAVSPAAVPDETTVPA